MNECRCDPVAEGETFDCVRYNERRNAHLQNLCALRQDYREKWDRDCNAEKRTLSCARRGEYVREEVCESCMGNVRIKVFVCEKHGGCTIGKQIGDGIACCASCPDYAPKLEETNGKRVFHTPPARVIVVKSEHRDENDWKRLRHARDRHEGFQIGRYLQTPPLLFTRDGHNLFLGDLYRGYPCFLLCAGPSLTKVDLSQLARRGLLTMALNNAAVAPKTSTLGQWRLEDCIPRPNLWVEVDDPGNFCDAIWRDPGIIKLAPLCHAEKPFLVRNEQGKLSESKQKVGDMPTVAFYRRNEHFRPEQFLYEDTVNWGNHKDLADQAGNKGCRSVFLAAIRLLFYLGVRTVYLVGADFKMTPQTHNYAFPQDRTRQSVKNNNATYKALNQRLNMLKDQFRHENFVMFNCTPDSGLTAVPYMEFGEAVKDALSVMPSCVDTRGMYDRKAK